jgi:hypothetical protein
MSCRLQRRLRWIESSGDLGVALRDFYTRQADQIEEERLQRLQHAQLHDVDKIEAKYDMLHASLITKMS